MKATLRASAGIVGGKGLRGTSYEMAREIDLPFAPYHGLWIEWHGTDQNGDACLHQYHVGPVAWRLDENRFEVSCDLTDKCFRCVVDSQAEVERCREWLERCGFEVTERLED